MSAYSSARAIISDGLGHCSLESIQVAQPTGDEVLVRLRAAGICHTDHASLRWGRPLVMGHEGAGVVEAIGPSVHHVVPGDRVVLNWAIPCRDCPACRRGDETLCESSRPAHVFERSHGHSRTEGTLRNGSPIDRSFNLGTLSDLTLVRAAAVTALPDTVSFAAGAICGCGVMTGVGSVINTARVQPGSAVAVTGCGGVGLNVIQGARIAGARRIIAMDTRAASLETARTLGATDVVLVSRNDPLFEQAIGDVRRANEGRGCDYAFEATSDPHLAFLPLRLIRDGGMALQLSGMHVPVTVDMRWFLWNKTYVSPLYGNCVPGRDFPWLFEQHRQGRLLLDELVGATYTLETFAQAMAAMLEGRVSKAVILFTEETQTPA